MKNEKKITAVIFDLDGVIVSSDKLHFQAWLQLANDLNISFSKQDNEKLKGVSRNASLEIMLKASQRKFSPAEKENLAKKKNSYFKRLIPKLSKRNILPGALRLIKILRKKNIKTAIASSSKNALLILKAVNLHNEFDAIVDGNKIKKSKPSPEIFLRAASLLSTKPRNCLIIEDSMAGVEAGLAGGMKVLAIGSACSHPQATMKEKNLARISVKAFLNK